MIKRFSFPPAPHPFYIKMYVYVVRNKYHISPCYERVFVVPAINRVARADLRARPQLCLRNGEFSNHFKKKRSRTFPTGNEKTIRRV